MIIYHGSNVIVEKPEIRIPNRKLDFGIGFYTTSNKEQAINFAISVFKRNKKKGKKIVTSYEIDFELIKQKFKVLEFKQPDEKWLDFVTENRLRGSSTNDYDLIIGPVANDTIFRTFVAYSDGILTREETLERLKVSKLYNQIVFKNKEVLNLLKYIGNEEI